MKTWHLEGAAIALILTMTVLLTGGHAREWIGALAVQLTFHHAAISDRMVERQALKSEADVSCWRWSSRLFLGKESLWLAYFGLSHTWSALVGVLLFLLYPLWRKTWRTHHPLSH